MVVTKDAKSHPEKPFFGGDSGDMHPDLGCWRVVFASTLRTSVAPPVSQRHVSPKPPSLSFATLTCPVERSDLGAAVIAAVSA